MSKVPTGQSGAVYALLSLCLDKVEILSTRLRAPCCNALGDSLNCWKNGHLNSLRR
ncbi:hypothetical protein At15955_54310 (plasmid) [Agrobacterium tumefaciens]|uniref:Uncharacterized protein n=1 Tax=Agrobacterium tumefaciens TaxID=358 RepID=A0A2L2LLP7_AGRTU|nr:hypothetical protein At1D1609_52240 [Agrobacterium tumefaciens]AYM20416.1 hypothetical protein At15955_54310 [Agrobacterium tumefaciens]SPZ48158.1 Uncharacterised protein [Agrobacterium tumefaciens]